MGAEHYDALMNANQLAEALPDVMKKAEACGVDCQAYKEGLQMALERLDAIRKTWFPKGPPK